MFVVFIIFQLNVCLYHELHTVNLPINARGVNFFKGPLGGAFMGGGGAYFNIIRTKVWYKIVKQIWQVKEQSGTNMHHIWIYITG